MSDEAGDYTPKIRSENLPTTRGQAIKLPPVLGGTNIALWEERVHDERPVVVLDLFCGAGGMSQGFASEGFFIAAGIDNERYSCETHAANFLSKSLELDLSAVKSAEDAHATVAGLGIPRVDVIIGGPPCQGFSVVGRARIRTLPEAKQREEIYKRNELYRNFFHFVDALKPLIFVMENVQTMRSWEDGLYFKDMVTITRRLGYDPFEAALNAADFGVPQVRRRQFLVGSRIGRRFRFPRIRRADPVSLQNAIGELPVVKAPQLEEVVPYTAKQLTQYQQLMRSRLSVEETGLIHDHVVRPVRKDDREIFQAMEPGHRYLDIDARYRRYNEDSFTDKYFMLRPDTPCVTITAHLAKDGYRYIHWDREQCRTLSVREAARAQSFDDAFLFAGFRSNRYRMIGNAVPPILAQELAGSVRRAIGGSHLESTEGNVQLELTLEPRPHLDDEMRANAV